MKRHYTYNKPVEASIIAEVGQSVYHYKEYWKQGRIIVDYSVNRPGLVQVIWEKPRERIAWIRLTNLRLKKDSKRLIFKR